jgi:hypothetical protein
MNMDKQYTPQEIRAFADWLEGEAVKALREQQRRIEAEVARTTSSPHSAVALAQPGQFDNPYELTSTAQVLRMLAIRRSL